MILRINALSKQLISSLSFRVQRASYATANISPTATSRALPTQAVLASSLLTHPSTQPPSHKPPGFRKSQLLRLYVSLIRSSPLLLIFQHNSLKANEWLALRRELTCALNKVDKNRATLAKEQCQNLTPNIKIQTVQTGIFAAAVRVVDFFKPEINTQPSAALDPPKKPKFTHSLSKAAHRAAAKHINSYELSPLLSGPICILSFPVVSPSHLKEAISILCPSPPDFPAPKKKSNPGWHDPAMQEAIQKLVLLGARVEGRTFDIDSTKTVGKIDGGLEGLQGQLVAMLQSIGASLTGTLDSTARSLYFTLETRRSVLEDESNGKSGESNLANEK